MDRLFSILHRNPFGIILAGIVTGIVSGYNDMPVIIPIIIIVISWATFLFLKFYGKTPQKSIKVRNYHWLWSFTLFVGLGMLVANLKYPDKLDLSELNAGNYAYASVKSVETTNYGDRMIVEIQSIASADGKASDITPFEIILSSDATDLRIGDLITFPINLQEIKNNDNYQGFDYASYMLNKGFRYQQYCHFTDITTHDNISDWRSLSLSIRDNLTMTIEKSGLAKPTQNFLITMFIGDKSYMPDSTRQSFNNTGIAHILALSGLHVGIIIIIINLLLTPLSLILPQKVIYLIVILFIWLFAFITGLSPSVVRASIMASFYLLSLVLERQNNSLNSLYAATSLILLVSPYSLFDVGLQLSVLTVACIILFSAKLNVIDRFRHQWTYKIVSTMLTTIIAVGGSWILIAYYFHTMPLMFIPANTIVIPLLPIFIGIAILHIILSSVGINLDFLIDIIDHSYRWLHIFTENLAFEGAVIDNIWVAPLTIVLYFICIALFALWLTERRRIFTIYLSSFIGLTILSAIFMPTDRPADGFIIQNRWDKNLIRIYHNGTDSLLSIANDTTGILKIYDRTIVYIDDNKISQIERKNDRNGSTDYLTDTQHHKECDYLVICKGYRGNISHLCRHYKMSMIVLMPEIHNSKEQSLIDQATRLNIPIYSIDQNGALSYFTK